MAGRVKQRRFSLILYLDFACWLAVVEHDSCQATLQELLFGPQPGSQEQERFVNFIASTKVLGPVHMIKNRFHAMIQLAIDVLEATFHFLRLDLSSSFSVWYPVSAPDGGVFNQGRAENEKVRYILRVNIIMALICNTTGIKTKMFCRIFADNRPPIREFHPSQLH